MAALASTYQFGTEADFVYGGDGDDLINGWAGNDTIYGDAGSDRIDGSTGVDQMYGGAGNDNYLVDDASDGVTERSPTTRRCCSSERQLHVGSQH
ncbi:MAG: hypothetical protein IPL62_12750 [Caulobacteraceae bacterium]|nr:hypothetical protein [Caulobacteraceae bacterium]